MSFPVPIPLQAEYSGNQLLAVDNQDLDDESQVEISEAFHLPDGSDLTDITFTIQHCGTNFS